MLLSTSAPDLGTPAAQMSRCCWDAHLCSHDHACSRVSPGTGTAGWAGSLGQEKPAWPTKRQLQTGPRRAWGHSVGWEEELGYVGCSHPDPFCSHRCGCLEKRILYQWRCTCPSIYLTSDCSLMTTMINMLFFLNGPLTFYSCYFGGDFF